MKTHGGGWIFAPFRKKCLLFSRERRDVTKRVQAVIKHQMEGPLICSSNASTWEHMGAFPGPAPILAVHHLLTPKDKSFSSGQGEGVVFHWTPSCSVYLLRRRLLPHLVSIACNYILRRTVHPDHEDGVQMSMWIHSSWLILIVLDSPS